MFMLLFSPAFWVFVEFVIVSLVIFAVAVGLGAHPVIGIVAGIATLVGLHVWLRAQWAGLVLLTILTVFWALLGGWIGWLFSPKSRAQLEWMHQHRMIQEPEFERRMGTALAKADPLWDAFFTFVGALVFGFIAYMIHRSVRNKSAQEDGPSEQSFEA